MPPCFWKIGRWVCGGQAHRLLLLSPQGAVRDWGQDPCGGQGLRPSWGSGGLFLGGSAEATEELGDVCTEGVCACACVCVQGVGDASSLSLGQSSEEGEGKEGALW